MADTVQSQSTNGTVPVDQQPDVTQEMNLDEKVQAQTPDPLPRVDINQAVTPGHDMVVNHVDGSQELAQGHVAAAVHAEEALTREVVAAADVDAGEAQENPRSADPEVNGPSKTAVEQGLTTDEVIAASQPDVNPNEVTPAYPTPTEEQVPAEDTSEEVPAQAPAEEAPAEPETPAEEASEPSAEDVDGV